MNERSILRSQRRTRFKITSSDAQSRLANAGLNFGGGDQEQAWCVDGKRSDLGWQAQAERVAEAAIADLGPKPSESVSPAGGIRAQSASHHRSKDTFELTGRMIDRDLLRLL